MSYGLSIVTAASSDPVTTDEAKTHVAVDDTFYDTFIGSLITAATSHVEALTNRQIMSATFDLKVDRFPGGRRHLFLPRGQLTSVTSVSYTDTNGASQTFSASDYAVVTAQEPGLIEPVYDKVWPAARLQADSVVVRFVAGYASAADVPQGIKQAILLLVGHWFNNREGVTFGSTSEVPMAVRSLADQFRLGDAFTCYAPAS
jgi:uncharacterized phiE125 gp8 family phage protein